MAQIASDKLDLYRILTSPVLDLYRHLPSVGLRGHGFRFKCNTQPRSAHMPINPVIHNGVLFASVSRADIENGECNIRRTFSNTENMLNRTQGRDLGWAESSTKCNTDLMN